MGQPAKALLVLGRTSDIGRATARAFGSQGWPIQLAGPDLNALCAKPMTQLMRHIANVTTHRIEILDATSFPTFIEGLPCLPNAIFSVGLKEHGRYTGECLFDIEEINCDAVWIHPADNGDYVAILTKHVRSPIRYHRRYIGV